MALPATYVDIDTLTTADDYTGDFVANRPVWCNCGGDGYKKRIVSSSSYSAPNTTVSLVANAARNLTANLTEVQWSVVKPGTAGNIPLHSHADEDSGEKIVATNLDPSGLTASQLLRVNAGVTAVESSGETVASFVEHSLATAVSDFLVASGAGAFVKKTLAETKTILGLLALAFKNTVGTTDIDNDAVTYAKMQNVSATDKVLGRSTAGAGDTEEIVCTAAGRALIDDADAAAQRTTLGFAGTNSVGAFVWIFPGALAIGSSKFRMRAKQAITFLEAELLVDTAPTGAALIVDINKNDTTIFTNQANRPQIADGAKEGESTTLDVTTGADDDVFTVDIDQKGSTIAGADLVVMLWFKTPLLT